MEQLREFLACGPGAGRQARLMLQRLTPPLSPVDIEVASLVVTELVTNAVRHGSDDLGGEIIGGLSREEGRLRIEVAQPGPLFDLAEVRLRRPGTERGWGVLLLDRLTEVWGVDTSLVWAEIAVTD